MTLRQGRYSEDVADYNIMQSSRPLSSDHAPAPLKIAKPTGAGMGSPATQRLSRDIDERARSSTEDRRGSVSRKPIGNAVVDKRQSLSSETPRSGQQQPQSGLGLTGTGQPLPQIAADGGFQAVTDDRRYIVKDAPQPPSLKGVVDLSNTEDTTVHESWAPGMLFVFSQMAFC